MAGNVIEILIRSIFFEGQQNITAVSQQLATLSKAGQAVRAEFSKGPFKRRRGRAKEGRALIRHVASGAPSAGALRYADRNGAAGV